MQGSGRRSPSLGELGCEAFRRIGINGAPWDEGAERSAAGKHDRTSYLGFSSDREFSTEVGVNNSTNGTHGTRNDSLDDDGLGIVDRRGALVVVAQQAKERVPVPVATHTHTHTHTHTRV
ncbi:hypothetical protein EYF80_060038 [Liparis tanakae]|uniref:Uncharacterized protein n=1 Tax=Liparis tanakae TaxID=230148 RepID=A0A4Z2EN43_9TELE|nr:hypothetical protein EYF80_060038 [Liparis tanakae]